MFGLYHRQHFLILLYFSQMVPQIEYFLLIVTQHLSLLHNLRLHFVLGLTDTVLILPLQNLTDLVDRLYLPLQTLVLLFQQTDRIRQFAHVIVVHYLCALLFFQHLQRTTQPAL